MVGDHNFNEGTGDRPYFKDTVFVNVEDESYAKPIYNGFSIGGLDMNEDSFGVVSVIVLRSATTGQVPSGKIGSFCLADITICPIVQI